MPSRWLPEPGPKRDFVASVCGLAAVAALLGGGLVPGSAHGTPGRDTTCDSLNPKYAAAVFRNPDFGPQRNPGPVVLFSDSQDNVALGERTLAEAEQVGAVYGLAYDARRGHLYAAAYHRRWVAFGPGGPGAIYRVDVTAGGVGRFANLDAGQDRHSDPSRRDEGAILWAGKTSLGDIDVDETMTELFVVNLHDRRIHRLSLPQGEYLGDFAHGAADEQWAERARLLGLGYRDGWLYHGVVDSQEAGAQGDAVTGYVYRSRHDGRDMALVARFDMDYPRQPAWERWTNEFDDTRRALTYTHSQPLVSDIEFGLDGSPIVGLRDRVGDMEWPDHANGDILSVSVDAGQWQVLTSPEHYKDGTTVGRDESAFGGLARFPHQDLVVATVKWPIPHPVRGQDGALWFDNATGMVSGPADGREVLAEGETLGLGDIELVCPPDESIPTPTASATPTPTSTATPTVDPTPTATSTSKATVTATPRPIFLPLALVGRCTKRQVHADVVLGLDVSTSMLRETSAQRTKLAAVTDAAQTFLQLLQLTPAESGARDQVAIVGFNDTAWLEQSLTPDRARLEAGLGRLAARVAEGTRQDLAVLAATDALREPARCEENSAVLILLTDGMPNRVPTPVAGGSQEDTVLAAAQRAKDLGVLVYTIGVGRPDAPDLADRINPNLLRAVASAPSMYYEAPSAEDLKTIYSEIGRHLTCP